MGGAVVAALLVVAATPADPAPPPVPAAIAAPDLAPPLDRPLRYRVISRRLVGGGDAMLRFTFEYRLLWQRAGRGYRLTATLEQIESDAPPPIARGLTAVLQPLVGEAVAYLVSADGRHVDLVDPDALWERVAERTHAIAAAAPQAEARQMAQLMAALTPAQRQALAAEDIRALIAAANPDIPPGRAGVTVESDGPHDRLTLATAASLSTPDGVRPLTVEQCWTIDRASGLIGWQRRQSWIADPQGGKGRLVEEQLRIVERP